MAKTTAKKPTGKIMSREHLRARRDIFLKSVYPLLEKQGFQKDLSVIDDSGDVYCRTHWGWSPGAQGHIYKLFRWRDGYLDFIDVYIPMESREIRVSLQILRLVPSIDATEPHALNDDVYIKLSNSRKNERLFPGFPPRRNGRINKFFWKFFYYPILILRAVPLFFVLPFHIIWFIICQVFFPNIPMDSYRRSYHLKRFFTRRGLRKSAKKLDAIMKRDFADVQPFIDNWLKIQNPDILNLNEMKIEETELKIR